jgi:two-component system sensor histidine kinase PilS (NtrC family)
LHPASPGDSLVLAPPVPTGDLSRRIRRLLLLRTLVISVVLGLSLWVLWMGDSPAQTAMWLQSSIIAATYVSSIVFGVMLRRGVAPARVARPMQVADVVVTSLLIYITGGAQSPYVFLYALSIVGAGALSYRRGAIATTIGSVVSLILVALLAWTHAIDLPAVSSEVRPWEQSGAELVRTLGIDLATLVGVGALSLIFGDQLQRGAETLATTRRAAADLLSLHQDIVRSLSSGLVTTAPDGTVLTLNQAAAEILGTTAASVVGKPIEQIMPGLSGDAVRRADLVIGDVTLGVTVSPLVDVHDQVIGRVVNFQDLTELRRLEEHMQRAQRLATVGQLAAGVAHEIRNPLASISGSIELLRTAPQATEDDRTLMAIVNREILRLNALIDDLLDYANPKPLQRVDIDGAVLIDETLQVAKGDPAFAGIEVTADVARPLPLTADPSKLRQVLWNLLRNAADSGGTHVTVTAAVDGDRVVIGFGDDGAGIPPDQVARIFDPFFTTKRRGTGLGLATCHGIVADHGGSIDVETTVGSGTKMIVSLPRR